MGGGGRRGDNSTQDLHGGGRWGAAPQHPLEGLERKSAKSLLGLKLSELDIKRDSQEKKPVQKSGQGESAEGREGKGGRALAREGGGQGEGLSHFFLCFLNLQF